MSVQNLSIVWGPNLFRVPNEKNSMSVMASQFDIAATDFLISHYEELFEGLGTASLGGGGSKVESQVFFFLLMLFFVFAFWFFFLFLFLIFLFLANYRYPRGVCLALFTLFRNGPKENYPEKESNLQ